MNMKYALSSILLCFSLFCLPSCNDNETPANTPDGEEVEEVIKSYDWQLEGKWEYASNNGNDFSRTLVFEKDGKGSYDDGTLEWYCSNNLCTLISTTANPSKIVTICFMGQLFS